MLHVHRAGGLLAVGGSSTLAVRGSRSGSGAAQGFQDDSSRAAYKRTGFHPLPLEGQRGGRSSCRVTDPKLNRTNRGTGNTLPQNRSRSWHKYWSLCAAPGCPGLRAGRGATSQLQAGLGWSPGEGRGLPAWGCPVEIRVGAVTSTSPSFHDGFCT